MNMACSHHGQIVLLELVHALMEFANRIQQMLRQVIKQGVGLEFFNEFAVVELIVVDFQPVGEHEK